MEINDKLAEEVFFPVELQEVPHPWAYTENDDFPTRDTKYNYVMNSETGQVISIMTKDYQLVSNKDLFNKIRPVIETKGGQFVNAHTFSQARTNMLFRFPDFPVKIEKDEIVPQMMVKNSYDGSTQISILGGAFRIICSNGLIVGIKAVENKFRHLSADNKMDKLDIIFEESWRVMDKVLNGQIPHLYNTAVKKTDIVKIFKLFPENSHSSITDYLISKRPKNYWDLLNCMTYTTTHILDRKYEATHNLEEVVYDEIVRMSGI